MRRRYRNLEEYSLENVNVDTSEDDNEIGPGNAAASSNSMIDNGDDEDDNNHDDAVNGGDNGDGNNNNNDNDNEDDDEIDDDEIDDDDDDDDDEIDDDDDDDEIDNDDDDDDDHGEVNGDVDINNDDDSSSGVSNGSLINFNNGDSSDSSFVSSLNETSSDSSGSESDISNVSIDEDFSDALSDEFSSGTNTDDSGDEQNEPINEDPPLFQGCPLTLSESLLSILSLTLRHTITGVLLASILQLIHLHCPEPNHCVQSLYTFKNYFEELKSPINRHFYCTDCLNNLDDKNSQCAICGSVGKSNYFMTISVISQLRAMYARNGFKEKLNYRHNRVKLFPDNIEDIYDGSIYHELNEPGELLSDANNISFTWYTDGVQVFNKSKFSFWPFYLVINELPYSERFKKENLILAAMWFGEEKPSANMFLLPLYDELMEIKTGVDFKLFGQEELVNVKGIIICGTCDLPAKAKFLNMMQYNGKCGCPKCKQEGKRVNNTQVYPYKRNMAMRTEEETLEQAETVTNKPICGVKGPTILSLLVYKWIQTTAIDAMHCVFEGIMKALLKLWFFPEFANMPFSLYHLVDVIDERLKNIHPPGFVQRRPRSIKKHVKYWKASELKNFFFYFSLIILKDVMKEEYFQNFQLLVGAIHILCQQSVSIQMIGEAKRLIQEFVSTFQTLYGLRNMSCNVHLLLHLPEVVEKLGPLWQYSCFTFEDINGKLKKLVHSSKNAELQIYNGFSLYLNTFTLNKDFLNEGTKVYEFCKKQLSPTKQMKLCDIGNGYFIVGGLSKLQVPNNIMHGFENDRIVGRRFFVFQKLLHNNFVYRSEIYRRAKVTNSTCVKFIIDNEISFGIINMFVRVTNCNCRKLCRCRAEHYAVVRKCIHEVTFPNLSIPRQRLNFIHSLQILNEFQNIHITSLKSLCFFVEVKDTNLKYAAEPVNTVEEE
ncbi:uncharacterized protein LOC122505177 [Leptopilina heterotoma]|uniref:uncharacterized protein LOC122505177 n=1 Tax=Leptopilina heterotoma TaxID=63436 RepID=UPI001CA7D508|nr:uncharacterized protein LOC122505177 [Leptopilina heterotoma]